ncbi:MAG: type III PLP-dependent enzyme, partial [Rickettsiales bacterium]
MTKSMQTVAAIAGSSPDKPQFVFRPYALSRAVNCFLQQFKGTCLYAVKTNPDNRILQELHSHGVRTFDVASLEEVALVRGLFSDVTLFFMHPVKSRKAIHEAYHTYGVRHFSLDSEAELNKILQETGNAKDLTLYVRLSIPNNFAEISLSEKFGINLQEAPELLQKVASHADKIGTCFHVGSQCMHPDAYRIAMRMAAEVIRQSGVQLDYFNVGGGFPSIYPGMIPPDMSEYFDAIHEEFDRIAGSESMQLLAEPGRAMVAESMSLLVRVELRKESRLYINEGTYGSLFDAGQPNFIFPMKLICGETITSSDLKAFSLYGPTCDSLDYMKGPFYLPSDIDEGDMIEIGQMGAYGRTMATGFNGFSAGQGMIDVSDEPLMTMYDDHTHSVHEKLEV